LILHFFVFGYQQLLLLGVMADWLSKELMFVIGAAVFMATAFLVLFVSGFTRLLMLRCVQGLGAAMISGTAVVILASLFPKETGPVIGINTTAVYVGTTLGPVLGGFMVNYAGWLSLFIFSGAFALVSAMLALLSLDFSKRGGKRWPHFETLLIFMFFTILVSVGMPLYESTL